MPLPRLASFMRSGLWHGSLAPSAYASMPCLTLFPGGGWERTRTERPEDFARFEAEEFPAQCLCTVQEIADAIVFVVSPRASGINAANIHVDDGQRRPSIR